MGTGDTPTLAPAPAPSGGTAAHGSPAQTCPVSTNADLTVSVTRTNDGRPVDGATVRISGLDQRSGTADPDGLVNFCGVTPGSYAVTASKTNYSSGSTTTSVAPSTSNMATVPLTADVDLAVDVVDRSNNRHIANATVRISGPETATGQTDATRPARFIGIASGNYHVEASHPSYENGATDVVVARGSTATRVALGSISVRIRAVDGTSDPPTVVAVGQAVQMRGVASSGASGSYQWTTTSTRVTLTNANAEIVTVTAGNQRSTAANQEVISPVFTPTGGTALAPVTTRLTVVEPELVSLTHTPATAAHPERIYKPSRTATSVEKELTANLRLLPAGVTLPAGTTFPFRVDWSFTAHVDNAPKANGGKDNTDVHFVAVSGFASAGNMLTAAHTTLDNTGVAKIKFSAWKVAGDRFTVRVRLLRNPANPAAGEYGPHLVEFRRGTSFYRWWFEQWGHSIGVLIEAPLSLADLRRHFRTLLIVDDRKKKHYYFRFYDPRVLRVFLPACPPEEAQHFFGPIQAFYCEADGGTELPRFTLTPEGISVKHNPVPMPKRQRPKGVLP
jgi:hypothetical protein